MPLPVSTDDGRTPQSVFGMLVAGLVGRGPSLSAVLSASVQANATVVETRKSRETGLKLSAASLYPLDLGQPTRTISRHTLAIGLEDDPVSGIPWRHGEIMAFDVLVGRND
jgi:hypothetical protein